MRKVLHQATSGRLRPTWRVAVALSSLLAAAGCNSVLGIDAATEDPTLSGASGGAGASGASGAGGEAGAAGTAGAAGGTPCDKYCATIEKSCTGDLQEYASTGVCLAMCGQFELGLPNDTTEDTLNCRQNRALLAATDPKNNCRAAGPSGGGVCGKDPCNAFCTLDTALCKSEQPPPYVTDAGCRLSCQKFTYLKPTDKSDLTFTGGDTLNCRFYHLQAAYNPDSPTAKLTHCPHTAVDSATCK